ncbi:MAG: hypothetical protein HY692_01415 [Cyanobacteria bacterium NC_groundwater_1444_Ag_S-0.65um_54_12]|nr:hypothetical protein [Cyanobacteria bacterium NC_groundwater_1444_Ag_S-0.65um_54_12]
MSNKLLNGCSLSAILATVLLASLTGCPQDTGTKPNTAVVPVMGDGGQVELSTNRTPVPIADNNVGTLPRPTRSPTPRPVSTVAPIATAPPEDLFVIPTPKPTPKPLPTLQPLALGIEQGNAAAGYETNQFRIPFAGDNRLTPDLPTSRRYWSFLSMGLGTAAASESLLPEGQYATKSTVATWRLESAVTGHTNSSTQSSQLVHFLVNAATTDAEQSSDSVVIALDSVPYGTLLTLYATLSVTAPPSIVFVENTKLATAVVVPIIASNEGWIDDFVITSLRVPRLARLLP